MNWPLPHDFNESIQNPATSFDDPDLHSGEAVVGPAGLPLPRSGNFADVYQIRGRDGRSWAVKCFTRSVTGLDLRYKKVHEALDRAALPFTVGSSFLTSGTNVRGCWYPVVKMEWVDGLTLNQVVRKQAGNPVALETLLQMWSRLCQRLREAGIAHGDLQHGNLLLVPGTKPGTYGLKLIDYDGMHIPGLANTPSGECGHPNYQHPRRVAERVYSHDLDRFPHLLIATAIKGLAVFGPKLWERYDTGDNLLFTEQDCLKPSASRLLHELWRSNDPGLQALAGHLAIAAGKPIPQTPWLDQILPNDTVIPLLPLQRAEATAALGLPPAPMPWYGYGWPAPAPVAFAFPVQSHLAPSVLQPSGGEEAWAGTSESEFSEFGPRRSRHARRSSTMPFAMAGCALLLGAVIGAIVVFGGKSESVARTKKAVPEQKAPVAGTKAQPVPEPSTKGLDRGGAVAMKLRWGKTFEHAPLTSRFTADGKFVIVREGGRTTLRVLSKTDGSPGGDFTEGNAAAVDFTPLSDGTVASWHNEEPFAVVWDPRTGSGIGKLQLEVPDRGPGTRVFETSPDARYVISGTVPRGGSGSDKEVGRVTVFDTHRSEVVLKDLKVRGPMFRFTRDGRLTIVDLDCIRRYQLPGDDPDGSVVKVENGDLARGKVLACSADASVVLHPGSPKGMRVVSLAGAVPRDLMVLPPNYLTTVGAVSTDGTCVAVCSKSTKGSPGVFIDVIDVSSGTIVAAFELASADATTMEFAPDHSSLAVCRAGRKVLMLDRP